MRRRIAIFLLFLLLTGLASGVLAATTPKLDDYKLRPGDVLAITVLGYDEFVLPANTGGTPGFLVRPDGYFSFPLIGEVSVQDQTVGTLTETLRVRLSEYLLEPKVSVNLARLGGTRVYVLGEVVKPGSYEIEKAHNLLDAITAAGGPTKDGAKRNVYVVRQSEPGKYQKVNLLAILRKGDQSQNVALNEGDSVFLTSNGRLNFASDVLPFITATYYIDYLNRK
ncbi:MAG: polysaccharide biosynthesis/export family protein [Negativicutes bacterium]